MRYQLKRQIQTGVSLTVVLGVSAMFGASLVGAFEEEAYSAPEIEVAVPMVPPSEDGELAVPTTEVPAEEELLPAPVQIEAPERLEEDDPRWDCRIHGNERCGVEIMGTWYVVTFEDGLPEGVYVR